MAAEDRDEWDPRYEAVCIRKFVRALEWIVSPRGAGAVMLESPRDIYPYPVWVDAPDERAIELVGGTELCHSFPTTDEVVDRDERWARGDYR